jgi:hypothetical protein
VGFKPNDHEETLRENMATARPGASRDTNAEGGNMSFDLDAYEKSIKDGIEKANLPTEEELREIWRKFNRGVVAAPRRRSILQDWVTGLGLRHQGVLLTAVRGCDTAPKDDPSKLLTRCIRAELLNAHCGDAAKAATFIERVDWATLNDRFAAFRRSLDHYPHHYVMHVVHAIEIIGYKHPDPSTRNRWHYYYLSLARGLHVNPETEAELDERLNADEETFAARDFEPVRLINRQEAPGGGGGGGA